MTSALRLASVACCIVILVLTTAEILLRLAGMRFLLSYEYCGFLLAALVFFALPAITRDEEHITVVTVRPRGRLSRLRRGFILGLTVVYLLVIASFCGLLTWNSYEDGARSLGIMLTPLYIPQIAMTVGLFAAAVALLIKILRRSRAAQKDGQP
jgi:TRAP-type C4-dicarboxylate transport system permease small subunit